MQVREEGIYWIRFGGGPPEPTRWDAEARGWLMLGVEELVPNDHPTRLEVIMGRLLPP